MCEKILNKTYNEKGEVYNKCIMDITKKTENYLSFPPLNSKFNARFCIKKHLRKNTFIFLAIKFDLLIF